MNFDLRCGRRSLKVGVRQLLSTENSSASSWTALACGRVCACVYMYVCVCVCVCEHAYLFKGMQSIVLPYLCHVTMDEIMQLL